MLEDTARAIVTAELDRLRRTLAARKGKQGWKSNCEAIEQRIHELEASLEPAP